MARINFHHADEVVDSRPSSPTIETFIRAAVAAASRLRSRLRSRRRSRRRARLPGATDPARISTAESAAIPPVTPTGLPARQPRGRTAVPPAVPWGSPRSGRNRHWTANHLPARSVPLDEPMKHHLAVAHQQYGSRCPAHRGGRPAPSSSVVSRRPTPGRRGRKDADSRSVDGRPGHGRTHRCVPLTLVAGIGGTSVGNVPDSGTPQLPAGAARSVRAEQRTTPRTGRSPRRPKPRSPSLGPQRRKRRRIGRSGAASLSDCVGLCITVCKLPFRCYRRREAAITTTPPISMIATPEPMTIAQRAVESCRLTPIRVWACTLADPSAFIMTTS